MDCPVCGKEMEKGRLTAGGYKIRWVGGGSFMDDDGVFMDEDGVTVTISRFSLSNKGTPACICRTCRKVVVDY